jgi:ABC-2 type transport system permease protein
MFLPRLLQKFATLLPTYHLSQMMLHTLGYASTGSNTSHWFGLIGFALIMLGIAAMAFRRLEQTT